MSGNPQRPENQPGRPVMQAASPSVQSVFAAAAQHNQAGRFTEAELLFRQVLAINPRHADSLHLLGVVAYRTGRHDLAIDLIGQAIAVNANEALYHSNLGSMLQQQGRLNEAVACYRRAIELRPDSPGPHNNLGNALKEQGLPEEAVACYRRAIEVDPKFPEAHNNLGVALLDQRRLDEAVACYRRAIEIKPDYPDALNNLGNALRAQGQPDEAIACYRRAIDLKPDYPEAHNNLGIALQDQGRADDAVACFRTALDLRPDDPETHINLGIALKEQGRLDEAVACYSGALDLRPNFPEAHYNRGIVRSEQGRLDEAIACYRRAIELKPDYPDAYNNLGNALWQQGRIDEAVPRYRQAIDLRPGYAEAHNNLGIVVLEQGRVDEALASGRRAIDLKPDYREAHDSLGNALRAQGQLDAAIASYRRAIELNPDYPDAHTNLAMALLARGDMAAGWEEYEWRWKTPQMIKTRRDFAQPLWRGEQAQGQTLLIHAEQGLGDTLQFCRYAPLATAHGLRVILEVPKALVRLLHSVPGVDQVVEYGQALPQFDLHCPMLSLPLALGTTMAAIPNTVPYLHADATQVADWSARLAATGRQGPRIGLVWAGNPRKHLPSGMSLDRRRSIAPDVLAPLFEQPGLHFISLQKDGPAAASDVPLTDLMGEVGDFADTAALVANLDLVISVDTSVAHLAAGLGKPVWLMDRFDPCWRWLTGRRDSPWYPTLRIYRQPHPGDWDAVIEDVRTDLLRFAGDHPATAGSPDIAQSSRMPDVQALFADAVRHHQGGRLADAEPLYRQVLTADPRHSDTLHLLGVICGQTGRHDVAVDMIRSAIAINPKAAPYHSNLGISLRKMGRHEEAVACFRTALDLKPDDTEAHNNLGIALREQGRLGEAVACYRRAIALRPDYSAAQDNLASALRAQGRSGEPTTRDAVDPGPDDAEAHFNQGLALKEQGRTDDAIVCYRRAIDLRPNYPEAHSNLGNLLWQQGRVDEAVPCYVRAIDLKPDFPEAHNNLGIALQGQGRLDEAIGFYRKAIDLNPNYPDAHNNLAMALLAQGDMATGWKEYEWRWKTPQMIKTRRDFAQPQWRGEQARGRTLLIHAEQGLGDTLQFCRYAPLAAARGLRVIMEVQPLLVRLLGCLPGIDQVVGRGDALPQFDLQCPMLSLPLALGTSTAIPSAASYLRADAAQVASWQSRLAAMGEPGCRIGLVWAGNPRNLMLDGAALDRRRSIPLDRLSPVFGLPGLHFFSLQKDGPVPPPDVPLIDPMGDVEDFADTAALVANLDLVISVDTSVAHLAAALGKPVWLLDRFDPCWRWFVGRRDSPWYPTLRIYRQPRLGDWDAVVESVRADLRLFAGDRPAATGSSGVAPPSAMPDAEALFADAVRHHQAGRLADAESLYRQVLTANPRHADGLHLLGVIGGQTGRHDLAADMIRRAIAINPKAAPYHSNLGISLRQMGRHDEAVACFRNAVDLKPDDPEAHNKLGIALKNQRQLEAAVGCFRKAIDLRPDYPVAHNNLGNALREQGLLDAAAGCFRKALDLKPDYPEAQTSLADVLRAQGRPDQAVAGDLRAIDLGPDAAKAHFDQGVALKEEGRIDEAVACYRRALDCNPDYAEAHNNLGNALRALRRLDEAVACLRRAIDLRPDYMAAHNNLGIALQAQGRAGDAVACYRRALDLAPDMPELHNNLGTALQDQGLLDEAIACYRRALDLNPDYAEAHNSLGAALQEQGRPDDAICCYRRAVDLRPGYFEAHNNLGTSLQEEGRLDEAAASCREAIGLNPDFGEAHNSLGTTLQEQGRLDDAMASFRRAIDLDPNYADAHCNLAMALLARGDLAAGWEENEWRWKTPFMIRTRRDFAQPQWRGEPAEGRTLLIHAEQGLGDTLQFCRYGSLAAARGLRVVMEVQPPLVRLLRSLSGIDRVVGRGEALPHFDLHCPMLSMPLALGTTMATIPGAAPYLRADAAQAAGWRTRLAAVGRPGRRVGLAWAGNPRTEWHTGAALDRRRSIAPEWLAPLFALPGLHFVSLQKDGPAAPAHFPLTDLMGDVGDFADTAALVANLDLVISVDTSVAHLAAALGKPVWLLDRFDPDWRWLTGRRDSPWYPTLRLYRQPRPGDWDAVVENLRADLSGFAGV